MKWCSRCKTDKPMEEFGKNRSRPDGKQVHCKECKAGAMRAYYSNPENKEKRRKQRVALRERNQEEYWYKQIEYRYGINRAQYEAMLNEQGGTCAICKQDKPLVIDHDHGCCVEKSRSCGQCVRGLLCSQCNTAIGMLGDSTDNIANALRYLHVKA